MSIWISINVYRHTEYRYIDVGLYTCVDAYADTYAHMCTIQSNTREIIHVFVRSFVHSLVHSFIAPEHADPESATLSWLQQWEAKPESAVAVRFPLN